MHPIIGKGVSCNDSDLDEILFYKIYGQKNVLVLRITAHFLFCRKDFVQVCSAHLLFLGSCRSLTLWRSFFRLERRDGASVIGLISRASSNDWETDVSGRLIWYVDRQLTHDQNREIKNWNKILKKWTGSLDGAHTQKPGTRFTWPALDYSVHCVFLAVVLERWR